MNVAVKARSLAKARPEPARLTTTLHPDEFPPLYAMICDGNCMEPLYADGTRLMFSRDEPYAPNDVVMLIKRPEYTRPGTHQMVVKKLILAPQPRYWADPDAYLAGSNALPMVTFETLNPAQRFFLDPRSLLGIHKCLGEIAVEQLAGDRPMTDEEVRAQYPRK